MNPSLLATNRCRLQPKPPERRRRRRAALRPPHAEAAAESEEPATPTSEPFWSKTWFIAVMAGLGVAALAAYVYSRVAGKSHEDEEQEADDVADEADDVDDVQVEEEDDIVVEETS